MKVQKVPRVGLLSSGNELSTVGEELKEGQIRDTNKIMLKTYLETLSCEIVDLGSVGDSGDEIDRVMQEATLQCDVIVTTGGVSMGELDLIKPYLERAGRVIFGRLNMKPGKPTTFGLLNSKLVFALPGNPVSSYVTASLFLPYALGCMTGAQPRLPALVPV